MTDGVHFDNILITYDQLAANKLAMMFKTKKDKEQELIKEEAYRAALEKMKELHDLEQDQANKKGTAPVSASSTTPTPAPLTKEEKDKAERRAKAEKEADDIRRMELLALKKLHEWDIFDWESIKLIFNVVYIQYWWFMRGILGPWLVKTWNKMSPRGHLFVYVLSTLAMTFMWIYIGWKCCIKPRRQQLQARNNKKKQNKNNQEPSSSHKQEEKNKNNKKNSGKQQTSSTKKKKDE